MSRFPSPTPIPQGKIIAGHRGFSSGVFLVTRAELMDLLLIEDDNALGKAIHRGLTEAGHECRWVRSGQRGYEEATTQKFDAVILDLMLPDLSGKEVMRMMRKAGVRTPVMILTALGSVDDRVQGLNAGADDYLVKPFAFPELLARLEAICRRTQDRPGSTLPGGPLTPEPATRRVAR